MEYTHFSAMVLPAIRSDDTEKSIARCGTASMAMMGYGYLLGGSALLYHSVRPLS